MVMRSLQYRAARPIAAAIALVLMALAYLAAQDAAAAPAAKLWPRWAAYDATSSASIDHKTWNGFLGKYVRRGNDGINRVAYATVTPADKGALTAYLARMAGFGSAATTGRSSSLTGSTSTTQSPSI